MVNTVEVLAPLVTGGVAELAFFTKDLAYLPTYQLPNLLL